MESRCDLRNAVYSNLKMVESACLNVSDEAYHRVYHLHNGIILQKLFPRN